MCLPIQLGWMQICCYVNQMATACIEYLIKSQRLKLEVTIWSDPPAQTGTSRAGYHTLWCEMQSQGIFWPKIFFEYINPFGFFPKSTPGPMQQMKPIWSNIRYEQRQFHEVLHKSKEVIHEISITISKYTPYLEACQSIRQKVLERSEGHIRISALHSLSLKKCCY